jgi:hypothetical protein
VLLTPYSVARSNFLQRQKIVSCHALLLKIETRFPTPHPGSPLPRQRPHAGAFWCQSGNVSTH